MAPLTRVTGKVFGSTAPANEIGQFGSALAGNPTNTSDIATIQALSAYTNGWGSAVISSDNFPPMEEVTGVLKTISYQACYLLQAGIPIYDSGTEYGVGDIVKVINGQQLDFYIAIKDINSGTANINKWGDTNFWTKALIVGEREIGVPQITLNPNSLPVNCIWLEGQEVAQADYPNLYAIYSNIYNIGTETSSNFRLPDFRDKYFCGVSSGSETTMGYVTAGLPNLQLSTSQAGAHTHTRGSMNITGKLTWQESGVLAANGCFTRFGNSFGIPSGNTEQTLSNLQFNAADGWTGETSSSGAHTHTITSSNSMVGAYNTVKVDGIKVRVYARYQ